MVILRDGRKLQGVFRSYDQYGELPFPMYGVNAKLHLLLYLYTFPSSTCTSHHCYLHPTFLENALKFPPIANFLLESTIERLHYKLEYADRDIGKLVGHIVQTR
jgi:hypothetical protein